MTEFLEVDGGTIAYEVTGDGPLVVLSHGIGDRRQAYRFLAPKLAQAGYRVASADLRGHGESSMGRMSVTGADDAITHPDIAADLLALIRHLGGPAVIVGHSISGGAATIAAVQAPDLVSGIVELNPFTKKQSLNLGGIVRVRRYRRGLTQLIGLQVEAAAADRQPRRSDLDVVRPAAPALLDDAAAVGLVRGLLLGEPHIPVRPEHLGLAQPAELGLQLGQQRLHRRPHVALVQVRVGVPVDLGVVGLQAVVEVDGVLAESVEPHASNCATSVFGATAR